MAKAVSQSRTQWVKKGTIVNGKEVQKGYLAQYGKPEKKVSARVKIVTDTESGKKAGETYKYKAGRTVTAGAKKKPSSGGTSSVRSGGGSASATPTKKDPNKRTNRLAGERYAAQIGTTRSRKVGDRSATSGTVSGAMAAQKAKDKKMTPAQRASRATSGYVRGSVGSTSVAKNMSKGMTRAEAMRAKRLEDTRNQGRNAAAIAGLVAGPALLATGPGAAAAGVAGRAVAAGGARIAAGAGRAARPVIGGPSKSGKSTSNKLSVAALRAQRAIERRKAAIAKAKKARKK